MARAADRKAMIRAAATELFLQRGYHDVSVADIADAQGITASALYHHYRNKQDLLLDVVLDGIDGVDTLIAQAPTLDEALRSLTDLVLGPRRSLAVWEPHARHLEGPQRELILPKQAAVVNRLVPLLRRVRPGIRKPELELVARAVLGVLGSRSRHRLSLPRRRDQALMIRLSARAALADVPRHGDARTVDGANRPSAGVRLPRRDQLLTEAVRLFDERGYPSVAMTDIGEAAGIVASGVYRHFPSKTDLLVAAVNRGEERLHSAAEVALTQAKRPPELLELLLRGHVAVSIEHRHLVGILATETDHLPDRDRTALRRFQSGYLDTWLQALQAIGPDRDPTELKILIHAVQTMVYFVVRGGQIALRPDVDGPWLVELGLALLRGDDGRS